MLDSIPALTVLLETFRYGVPLEEVDSSLVGKPPANDREERACEHGCARPRGNLQAGGRSLPSSARATWPAWG